MAIPFPISPPLHGILLNSRSSHKFPNVSAQFTYVVVLLGTLRKLCNRPSVTCETTLVSTKQLIKVLLALPLMLVVACLLRDLGLSL